MPKFLTEPVPHEEGVKAIAGKPAVTRRIFGQLGPELQARAFVITGVEAIDCVERVRDIIAELPAGGDFKELKGRILAEMSPWLVDPAADDEEKAKQLAAANRRAEMLLRMHGWQAYAGTQYQINEAHKDVFPFRQYLTSEDNRVRPHHAALDKKILPADHPFWLNHTPPWEFNCRCDCVVLTEDEAHEIRAGETHKAPEDKLVMPDEQLREIETQKRIVKPGGQGFLDLQTPREKSADGKGYEWRPGEAALSYEQILERYTPEQRAALEEMGREYIKAISKPGARLSEVHEQFFGLTGNFQEGRAKGRPPGGEPRYVDLAGQVLAGESLGSGGAGPVDRMEPDARAKVERREHAIRRRTLEHGSLFDADGNGREDFEGGKVAVSVPDDVRTAGRVFTHNHPGGRSFSPADIEQLYKRRLAEVRVATRHGTFSVRPVPGRRLGEVMRRAQEIQADVEASLLKVPGSTSPEERDRATEHLTWAVLAQEGLIQYHYTPMRPQEPIPDSLAAPEPKAAKDDGKTFYDSPMKEGLEAVLERLEKEGEP